MVLPIFFIMQTLLQICSCDDMILSANSDSKYDDLVVHLAERSDTFEHNEYSEHLSQGLNWMVDRVSNHPCCGLWGLYWNQPLSSRPGGRAEDPHVSMPWFSYYSHDRPVCYR